MKNYLLIATFLLSINFFTKGQAVWHQFQGPFTGDINFFTQIGDTIYAGSNYNGLFKSIDFGNNWTSTGLAEASVSSLISYDSLLIACAGQDIFTSTNWGISWKNPQSIPGQFNSFYLFKNHIFAASTQGVYIFDPKTNNLQPSNNGLSATEYIEYFSSIGNKLFCSTLNDGLFFSSDTGKNWINLSSYPGTKGLPELQIKNYNDTLYVSNWNGGFYQSNDTGKSWIDIRTNLYAYTTIYDFIVKNDSIYAATTFGVNSCNKNILNWLLNDPYNTSFYSTLFGQDSIFLASNLAGVYKSTKSGTNFKLSNSGINTAKIFDMAIFNKVLYAATETGVYYTTDDGKSWNTVPQTIGYECRTIGLTDTMIFLGVTSVIYSKSIHSDNWQRSDNGITSFMIWDIRSQGNTLFAATDSGPFISKNNGSSWTPINKGFGKTQALAIESGSGMVLASNNFGLYKLSSDSTTWNLVGFQNNGGQMIKIIDTIAYFCQSTGGLFKSSDSCKTWVPLEGFSYPENGKPVIYDMFKRGGRNIYASGVLYIFYSSDLGLHWDNVSETGMPNQYIYRVIQGDSALYAGTYGNSIWKRDYLKLTNCSSTKYNVSNDNISNIPYNTTIDTLISNLQLAHGATAYVENMAKSGSLYVKAGDIVKILAEDSTTMANFTIQVATYVPTKVVSNLVVYPSPTKDNIYFNDVSNIESVIITDMQGKTQLQQLKMENNYLNVSNLPDGLYIISVLLTNNQTINLKLQKY